MTTTITATNDKKLICLNYLSLAAKDYRTAEDNVARVNALRVIRHYMSLALQHGCTVKEIRLVLAWSEQRVLFLIDEKRGKE